MNLCHVRYGYLEEAIMGLACRDRRGYLHQTKDAKQPAKDGHEITWESRLKRYLDIVVYS